MQTFSKETAKWSLENEETVFEIFVITGKTTMGTKKEMRKVLQKDSSLRNTRRIQRRRLTLSKKEHDS